MPSVLPASYVYEGRGGQSKNISNWHRRKPWLERAVQNFQEASLPQRKLGHAYKALFESHQVIVTLFGVLFPTLTSFNCNDCKQGQRSKQKMPWKKTDRLANQSCKVIALLPPRIHIYFCITTNQNIFVIISLKDPRLYIIELEIVEICKFPNSGSNMQKEVSTSLVSKAGTILLTTFEKKDQSLVFSN